MVHRRKNKNPRLLSHVVKAVKYLREGKGSSTGRITDQVRSLLNVTRITPKPRNVVMQVKRALKHAVQTGILLHRAGRYKVLKQRNLVPVDSLGNINSIRIARITKNRRRRSSRTRFGRQNGGRRHSPSRHRRHRSESEDTTSPPPKRKKGRKNQQKNKRVIFKDPRARGKNPSKEKVNQENNENSNKTQDKQNDIPTKHTQRPRTPYVSFKEMKDADDRNLFSKQEQRQRQQTATSRHRSMSRPRSSKPFKPSREPTDDTEFRSASPKKTSKTSHHSADEQQKSFTDFDQPDHDDTSSESLPDDDDDNKERENAPNNYQN